MARLANVQFVAEIVAGHLEEERQALLRLHRKRAAYRGAYPPPDRRCTKRLGSRFCWGWALKGTDRCWRHPRGLRRPTHTRRVGPRGARRRRRQRYAAAADRRRQLRQLQEQRSQHARYLCPSC